MRKDTADIAAALRPAWEGSVFGPEQFSATREALIIKAVELGLTGVSTSQEIIGVLCDFVLLLIRQEPLFTEPPTQPLPQLTYAELLAERGRLLALRSLVENPDRVLEKWATTVALIIAEVLNGLPSVQGEGIACQSQLIDLHGNVPLSIEQILGLLVGGYSSELTDKGFFKPICNRLFDNTLSATGITEREWRKNRDRQLATPSKMKNTSPRELVASFLGGTPIADLYDLSWPIVIPNETRFEHHWIVAGSGHGKTQTLQYLIAHDLDRVARSEASVIVIDSQGDLIKNIAGLAACAPGGVLEDRLCLIDPTDIEYPVALNLFDVSIDRINEYSALDRERLTNSVLELYDFVIGSLLSAELTQKQGIVFRYIMRLMLHIPDANIQTLRQLMEPGASERFKPQIEKLSGTARAFFDNEFNSKQFEETKRQVARRLYGILENQTFERMFSHPRNKLDLFSEMNGGRVILINTAKELLKQTGTEILGRFFIAMIAQAAQERAVLPKSERLPCFVYIDECQDYVDANVALILEQARKFNVGLILAHQYVGQLSPKLQESFAANTSVKFAGGVSDKDARALSHMLRTTPEFIESQRKGTFAAFVRNVTDRGLALQFPFGFLEQLPRSTKAEFAALRDAMRKRYAVHYSEVEQVITAHVGTSAGPKAAAAVMEEKDLTKASKDWAGGE
ncbi:ATP-binding protein [Rhodomicrobium vannielii ATCC 17100]|uniref:type IV secretory system conjugative DNA transfer family protein n=1 Tax=Rhodomicrobium vannielii TaxID=1069 RepID=UPI00191A77B4|nr:ATP-binding protein [Rhodomicrobium vannielii]MBJ7533311.1 ATP-binding protein [Rhodomicrobium vannielii ATCC 17100]